MEKFKCLDKDCGKEQLEEQLLRYKFPGREDTVFKCRYCRGKVEKVNTGP